VNLDSLSIKVFSRRKSFDLIFISFLPFCLSLALRLVLHRCALAERERGQQYCHASFSFAFFSLSVGLCGGTRRVSVEVHGRLCCHSTCMRTQRERERERDLVTPWHQTGPACGRGATRKEGRERGRFQRFAQGLDRAVKGKGGQEGK